MAKEQSLVFPENTICQRHAYLWQWGHVSMCYQMHSNLPLDMVRFANKLPQEFPCALKEGCLKLGLYNTSWALELKNYRSLISVSQ